MKAGEKFLLRYLEGHDKCFVIPVYQRNYDWKKEQCQQLFDDIIGILTRNQKTYFIGSIVSIYDEEASSNGEYVIIDGQQRITTLSLFLLAIHNLLDSNEITSTTPSLKDQIKDTYLVNKYSEGEKRIRLKPIKDDNKAFLKLFNSDIDEHIADSNITSNYLYLSTRIKEAVESGISIDQLYDAIKRLMIVDIKLKRGEDNPQLIFESLNSTGKQLEEADLVRNFILMDKAPRTQEKFYEQFWHPIEKNTDYRVGDFLRDYLTYSSGKTPRKDRVYLEFKLFVTEKCKTDEIRLEELLKDLLLFSKFYHQFLFFDSPDESVNATLRRIARLQVTVAYPFLLDVFHAWSDKIIDAEGVAFILATIESFVFRRLICNVPTNALNKIFATLGRNIRKVPSHTTQYVDIFSHYITAGSSSNRFPNDIEFAAELKKRDVYNLKSKNRIHLYERLENHNNREAVDVENLIEASMEGLTFEHIMPQTLTSKWKDELGEQYALIHEQYLHTLGNITLTAYNSELTNKPFLEKLNKENGLRSSRLWLNQNLHQLNAWGETEITDRASLLAGRAVQIWPFAESLYTPAQKQQSQLGLYDEYNFAGTKPKSFTLIEEEHSATSWRELYQKTAKLLHTLDAVAFEKLAREPASRKYMSAKPASLRDPWQLSDRIYLEINLSADGIVSALKYLFAAFKIEESDFTITLREEAALKEAA